MHKIFFYNKFIIRFYVFQAQVESGLSPLSTCAREGHLQV